MTIQSVDPRTGQTRRTYAGLDEQALDAKLELASSAFAGWRRLSIAERARPMLRAAELLESECQTLGRLASEEMGKPIGAAVAEIQKCARVCHYYADVAGELLADEFISTEAQSSYVRYLPLGPVVAVMPWNFPFWQVFRFVAPTLMAGNVGLLKHASNVPECALAIESLLSRAGFPLGVFQSLLIGSERVGRVIADRRVVAVTLTGSNGAGAAVGQAAGKLIKPTLLELGGSDAFIVMPSADLQSAVRVGVLSRILNNGQSCINAKRFIVHRDVYREFEQRMVSAFEALKVGDPLLPETDVGPLALRSVRDEVAVQVEQSVALGARRLVGAHSIERDGFWYQPGILVNVPESAPAFREEVFGPVAMLFRVDDIDSAIALANRSEFGLGSSVWTREPDEQRRFIDDLQAGQTFVNAMVASDPRLPFGGIKASGYGRELGTPGIRSFVNPKTVYIAPVAGL